MGLRELILTEIRRAGGEKAFAEQFELPEAQVRRWASGSDIPFSAADKVFSASSDAKLGAASWEGRNVALCLPFYKTAHPYTLYCLLALFDRAKMFAELNHGDAFVAHSRNTIAKRFLDGPAEWSLWIDDDMVIPCGKAEWFNKTTRMNLPQEFAGMNAASRLLAAGKTLVGGLYFGRSPTGAPMYAEGFASPTEAAVARRAPVDVVKPTKWVATGCLLIHRSVFKDIAVKFPHLDGNWFSSSEHDLVSRVREAMAVLRDETSPAAGRLIQARNVLDAGLKQGASNSTLGCGEDVQFCIRAAQAGHQPHVDLGLVCGHIGNAVYGPHNTSVK